MKIKKQLIFPIFIALGMSLFSACGNNNPNEMQDNGNATGTLPEGDNTMMDTTDLRDTNTYDEGTTDSLGRQDTSGLR